MHLKKPYEKPELEINEFALEDITCTGSSAMDVEGADWLLFEDLFL